MSDISQTKERWHVGKEIPLAVVITMVLQAAMIVWFAAKMDNRIDINSASIERNLKNIESSELEIDDLYDAIADQNVINARLDVTMKNIDKTLENVNRHMEFGGK